MPEAIGVSSNFNSLISVPVRDISFAKAPCVYMCINIFCSVHLFTHIIFRHIYLHVSTLLYAGPRVQKKELVWMIGTSPLLQHLPAHISTQSLQFTRDLPWETWKIWPLRCLIYRWCRHLESFKIIYTYMYIYNIYMKTSQCATRVHHQGVLHFTL